MLNDRQSLILCGFIAIGFFVSGILDILDNYLVKTILTILFLVIIANFLVVFTKSKNEEQEGLE